MIYQDYKEGHAFKSTLLIVWKCPVLFDKTPVSVAIVRSSCNFPISEMEKFLDQRANIKFLAAQGKSQAETYRTLSSVYGGQTMSKTQCRHWFLRFQAGDLTTPIKDAPRSGRPRSARNPTKIGEIQRSVQSNTRTSIPALARQHALSTGSVHNILHKDLHLSKKTAKFVPRLLSQDQMDNRVKVCKENVRAFEANPGMIRRIITGDESSFCTFQPETKEMSKQWMPRGKLSARPKKALRCATKKSTMLICFFDFHGLLHHEFVPPKTKVTSEFYGKVLARLREQIRKKRPDIWKNSDYWILHDNAPVHTAGHTVTRMWETDMKEIPHPAYSPDLAPCDFWMFPAIKKQLKGQEHRTIREVQEAVLKVIQNFTAEDYEIAFDRLLLRWRKCIASGGAYFEGDGVIPADPAELSSDSE